jgi:hypothetical protein
MTIYFVHISCQFTTFTSERAGMAIGSAPEALEALAAELQPYIQNRHDTQQTRKLIASHLRADVSSASDTLTRPLSLVDTQKTQSPPQASRSLYKDYLRALNSNLKARVTYDFVANRGLPVEDVASNSTHKTNSKEAFISLTRSQHKHDRLHIIHEHIEKLTKHEPILATADTIGARPGVKTAPQVPSAVLSVIDNRVSSVRNLDQLTSDLEKAVLKARMLLKHERKLLATIRSEQSSSATHVTERSKVRALGSTRNELINWMENELSNEGADTDDSLVTQKDTIHNIPVLAERSTNLYDKYVKVRRDLLDTTAESSAQDVIPVVAASDTTVKSLLESPTECQHPTPSLLTYLDRVVLLANEQKAITQQKSHMALSLSKHNKTMTQMLDRQAEESHILPNHIPTNPTLNKLRSGPSSNFAEEMSASERPDLVHRTRAWAQASEVANKSLEQSVSGHLEIGGGALLDAQETLLGLLDLLGNDVGEDAADGRPDIWRVLDGKLGII